MARPDFCFTAQCGCCLSIACSLAGALIGFTQGARASQRCDGYPDGDHYCPYPNDGNDLPQEWALDGAIIGLAVPMAITLCCLCGELAKYRWRNATDSPENKDLSDKNNEYIPSISPSEQKQSSYLTAGVSALFSSIKNRITGYQQVEKHESRNIPQL